MVTLHSGMYKYENGAFTPAQSAEGREKTMAHAILTAHNTSGSDADLKIKFDAMASHDITYVGIIQTARASGMKKFPLPYVLTNCHNSLCAVGGTINEDDHLFGLSAAKKYGGIFVPAHQAVIHQYMRERMAGCGKMLLGSDSHTRYGALGTMGVGEGGPELVKQLCERTYDIAYPDVVAIHLTGKPGKGVGPQDVALAIIREVFACGFVKNKVMEFVGPGIGSLSVEYRNGIDVMTTETTCLSSIWETDEKVRAWYETHLRPEAYKPLHPQEGAVYDGLVEVDLMGTNALGYSGSYETAKELIDMGWMLSFTGVITHDNSKKVRRILQNIPLEHIMIETDSPYMTPAAYKIKGQRVRNCSRYVHCVADKIAETCGLTREEVERITTENGKRFFRIPE